MTPPVMLDAGLVHRWFVDAANAIAEAQPDLDALDAVAGDGDHGTAMRRGLAAAVVATDPTSDVASDDAGTTVVAGGMAVMSRAGGTSGMLVGGLLVAMGRSLVDGLPAALAAGTERLAELGRVSEGDKSMLDALAPAASAAGAGPRAAAEAAAAGRDATASMQAKVGRARFVAGGGVGAVDPGAATIALLLGCLADLLEPAEPATGVDR